MWKIDNENEALYLFRIFVQSETGRKTTNFYWVRFLFHGGALFVNPTLCSSTALSWPPPNRLWFCHDISLYSSAWNKKLFSLILVALNKMFSGREKICEQKRGRLDFILEWEAWGKKCINFLGDAHVLQKPKVCNRTRVIETPKSTRYVLRTLATYPKIILLKM